MSHAAGAAFVWLLVRSNHMRWLWWSQLDTVVAVLLTVAGLTAGLSICLGLLALRSRKTAKVPVHRAFLCIGALSLVLVVAMAIRWDAAVLALNIIIPKGFLELSGDPQGTYIAGTVTPNAIELRPLYLSNANGVTNIVMSNDNGCFITQVPEAGGTFGVFVEHHYWPLEPHVRRGYFRVAVALPAGVPPKPSMATWEKISAWSFINQAISCKRRPLVFE